VARARGRLTDARSRLDDALVCIERIRASLGGAALRASLVSLNHVVYEDHVDVLASLHRERPTEGFDRLALEASELSRARSLLDVLATSSIDIRAGVDATLLDRERALRQRLADKDVARHRAVDNGQASAAAGLEREIAELTDALRTTESAIAASGPGFAALTRPRAVEVDALRRDVLDDDTVLLEYAVGNDRTWLFALTPTTLDTFDLPGRTRLDPVVRAALDAVTARQRDAASQDAAHDAALRTALGELSAQLLGPIADRLRGPWQGKRIVVVASGAIEYVPFAALPLPGGAEGTPAIPLVAAHEVVAAPSAAAIAALRRETAGRAPATKTLAIVADPVFEADDPRVARARQTRTLPPRPAVAATSAEPGAPAPMPAALVASRGTTREPLGRLLFSRREATALTAMLPAAERLVVTDFAATRRWALEAPLDRYRIVHFATHGMIDARRPALSSLVLSLVDERGAPIDGYLRMADIYNRRLPVDLVVLSACRTALGADVQGEGLVGLTRGFMYAGARRVVASLWQVDDQATAQLMTRFYRHMLTGGQHPAAALRAAQRELAADPRFAAPYFWAGFVIQGDWR
jgi:CHAT domain-containing protein